MHTKWNVLKDETMRPAAQRKARQLGERDLADIETRQLRKAVKAAQEERKNSPANSKSRG